MNSMDDSIYFDEEQKMNENKLIDQVVASEATPRHSRTYYYETGAPMHIDDVKAVDFRLKEVEVLTTLNGSRVTVAKGWRMRNETPFGEGA